MSTRRMNRHNPPRVVSRFAGFTLIELMIAMLLGLIVIAGVTSVFLAGQQSYRTNGALADVQDSSRIAFELMARDIREAGLTGCNSVNGNLTNVLANSGTTWWANWGNTIHGYDDASTDPALSGLATGAPVAGSNSLELISADTDIGALADAYDGSVATFTVQTPAPDYQAGDVVMVCSPGHAAIAQLGSFSTTTGEATFDASGNPGNTSVDLTFPVGSGPCTTPDLLITNCFPANSLVSKVNAVDWYIGSNPEGGTSLYRVSLKNQGGKPTPTTQEMVRNVTGMKITYLNPVNAAQFFPASSSTVAVAGLGWQGVTAVNVQLTVASTFKRASAKGDAPISRKYSFTTTLRNRVD